MRRALLHLVDRSGVVLNAEIHAACEKAFTRVVLDLPNFDQALIADWAEELAAEMDLKGEAIQFPKRYAYMALRGRVRDWFRTGAGRAELRGIGPDLEAIPGDTKSFTEQTEREILFEQILPEHSERDRYSRSVTKRAIYGSSCSVLGCEVFGCSQAMQRMKDWVSAVLNDRRHKAENGPGVSGCHIARGMAVNRELIKDFLRESFPNPERKGCPDEDVLQALAEDRMTPNDPALLHVGTCSECYREYLHFDVSLRNHN